MRTVGWTYLAGVAVDAVLSTVALREPGVLTVSNLISSLMYVFSAVVFMLALLGELTPRRIFFALSCYYGLMMAFGIAVAVLLAAKLGPGKVEHLDVTPQFLRQQFDWFGQASVVLLIVLFALLLYCVLEYIRDYNISKSETEPDRFE